MELTNEVLVEIDRDLTNMATEVLDTMSKLEAMLYELGAIRKKIRKYATYNPPDKTMFVKSKKGRL